MHSKPTIAFATFEIYKPAHPRRYTNILNITCLNFIFSNFQTDLPLKISWYIIVRFSHIFPSHAHEIEIFPWEVIFPLQFESQWDTSKQRYFTLIITEYHLNQNIKDFCFNLTHKQYYDGGFLNLCSTSLNNSNERVHFCIL